MSWRDDPWVRQRMEDAFRLHPELRPVPRGRYLPPAERWRVITLIRNHEGPFCEERHDEEMRAAQGDRSPAVPWEYRFWLNHGILGIALIMSPPACAGTPAARQ